jgi:PAS domain S-box-containing protein
VIKGERPSYQVEHRVHKPDGEIIWILSEGRVVERGADGRALRAVGTNRDITERKRMELALRASEAELRLITDNVPAIISYLDADLRYRFINQRFTEMFGLRTQDVYGKHLREVFGEDIYHAVEAHVAKTLSGNPVTLERSQTLPDGKVGHFESRLIPHFSETKSVDGLYSLTLDITEQKGVRDQLHLAASVFDGVAEGVVTTDAERTIVAVNAAFSKITGYSPEESVGRTPKFLASGLHDAQFFEHLWDSITRTGHWEGEILDRRKNGEIFPAWASISAVKDERGKVIQYVDIFSDISESKQADQRLCESETRFRTLLEVAPEPIVVHVDGRYVYANPTALKMLGARSLDAILGKEALFLVHPDSLDMVRERLAKHLRGEPVPSRVEQRWVRFDGTPVEVEVTTVPFVFDGKPAVHVMARDITERKRGEAQQRLATGVFDNAAEGILITDKDNNILSVNRAFTEITGYSPEEAIGRNPRMLSSGWQSGTFYDAMWKTIRETGRWQGEVWDRRKDGRPYCELLSIAVIRDDKGKIAQHCAIFSDITKLKLTEAELMALNAELEERVAQRTAALDQANKELESFSYSVSHDLRAPLRHISGFSAIVLKENEGKLDEVSVDYLKRINAAGERMRVLIDDLLALSRVSRQELHKRDFDFSELAGQVVNSLAKAHPERRVRVTIKPEMKAHADPGLVRIVLENLIGNAWKFTSRANEPAIEVGLEERDGETVYYVRDNGAGFDMKYAGKLFGAFQRLHTPAEFEGTGIGLSIVQRIVARHGGRIWAEAEAGKGATFHFTLGKNGHPA